MHLNFAKLRLKSQPETTVYDLFLEIIEANHSGKVCVDRRRRNKYSSLQNKTNKKIHGAFKNKIQFFKINTKVYNSLENQAK